MTDLEQRIALARTHVENGRDIVARQCELIASGIADTADGRSLLDTMERSLKIFEEDLERLEHEKQALDKATAARRNDRHA